MGMDRNTIIGFVLLGLMLFAYLYISTKNSQELQRQKQIFDDSVARLKLQIAPVAKVDDSTKNRTVLLDTSGFNRAINGTEKLLIVENELMKIVFTNKGGQPKQIELKKFNSYDGNPVQLLDSSTGSKVSYLINTATNQSAQISDLYFSEGQVIRNQDGSQTVDFQLPSPSGETLDHHFTVRPGEYLIDWDIHIGNPEKLFSQNSFNLAWHVEPVKTQKNITYEKRLANIS